MKGSVRILRLFTLILFLREEFVSTEDVAICTMTAPVEFNSN